MKRWRTWFDRIDRPAALLVFMLVAPIVAIIAQRLLT